MSPLLTVPVTARDRHSCTATEVLRLAGDKWSLLLLGVLEDRSYGFNELDRAVEGLSRRILSRTLQALVREGLVERTEPAGPAGRVGYSLSALGRSFLHLGIAMGRWAEEHDEEITAARLRHDAAAAARADRSGQR